MFLQECIPGASDGLRDPQIILGGRVHSLTASALFVQSESLICEGRSRLVDDRAMCNVRNRLVDDRTIRVVVPRTLGTGGSDRRCDRATFQLANMSAPKAKTGLSTESACNCRRSRRTAIRVVHCCEMYECPQAVDFIHAECRLVQKSGYTTPM